jgi:hypothetical protein
VVFPFHRVLDPKTGGPVRGIGETIKEINARMDVAEHAKSHDHHPKNLPPHAALVGGVELPQAQLWLDARFQSTSSPPASNFSTYQHAQVDQSMSTKHDQSRLPHIVLSRPVKEMKHGQR